MIESINARYKVTTGLSLTGGANTVRGMSAIGVQAAALRSGKVTMNWLPKLLPAL